MGIAQRLQSHGYTEDALALIEGTEAVSCDRGVVDEHVRAAAVLLDESETFFGVEPLNCTLCHFS